MCNGIDLLGKATIPSGKRLSFMIYRKLTYVVLATFGYFQSERNPHAAFL